MALIDHNTESRLFCVFYETHAWRVDASLDVIPTGGRLSGLQWRDLAARREYARSVGRYFDFAVRSLAERSRMGSM